MYIFKYIKVLHPIPNLARHTQGLRMLDEEGFSV